MTIYRYEVPVDAQWHDITLTGPIVKVAARQYTAVEFWALTGGEEGIRRFRVYGTGHPFEPDIKHKYVGTGIVPGSIGNLVWHLMEVAP